MTDSPKPASLALELRDIMALMRRRRHEARPGGFTEAQLLVLSRLERAGPTTVTVLASDAGMRPQSMGAIVASLEQAKLLARSPDPNDGRQSILSLTPAAGIFVKEYRAARDDWLLLAIETRLSTAEQRKLGRGLALIRRLIEH